ncbi:hypothetical protein AB3N59_01095 [Leptospira sp. WS92.C1]
MKDKIKIWIENGKTFLNEMKVRLNLEKYVFLFKDQIWKSPKTRYPFLGISVLLLIVFSYLIFRDKYSIDSSIEDPAYLIPEDAELLVEIFRPEDFVQDLFKTNIGKKLSEDGTFRKILTLPELRKVSSVLYLLEAKAGILTEPSRLTTLFDGPVATALFEKSQWLVVGKASVKSRLGVSLLTLFQGEKIAGSQSDSKIKTVVPSATETNDENQTGSEKTHSADDFTDQFAVGSQKFGNLEAYQYEFGNEKVFITTLGNFILITNSKIILDRSLGLASSIQSSSFGNLLGYKDLKKSAKKKENKLLLFAGKNSLLTPILKPSFESSGLGLLLGWQDYGSLEGEVYRIGGNQTENTAPTTTKQNVSKIIPKDVSVVFYSEILKPADVWRTLTTLDGEWKDFSAGFSDFAESAGIEAEDYFQNAQGLGFSFHGLDLRNGMIYPRFGISLSSSVGDDRLLKSVFKVGSPSKQRFQNSEFTSYSLKQGGYYSPASVRLGEWTFLSSDRKSAEETISAKNGNRPNQGDLFALPSIQDHREYPHHFQIYIPNLLNDLEQFYLYGARNSTEYTSKTIDRDIKPFFDKLRIYSRVSISFGKGKAGESWGKFKIISE